MLNWLALFFFGCQMYTLSKIGWTYGGELTSYHLIYCVYFMGTILCIVGKEICCAITTSEKKGA